MVIYVQYSKTVLKFSKGVMRYTYETEQGFQVIGQNYSDQHILTDNTTYSHAMGQNTLIKWAGYIKKIYQR